MATIFSHPAIPVMLGLAYGKKTIPAPLLLGGIFASILPDFDCIGFAFDIPYESQFGHRGFTHSIVFALCVAALFAWRSKKLHSNAIITFMFIFISTLSHPLIDALTDGGLGVALFWPFNVERIFFEWQPIPVSPIGGGFLSLRGASVFAHEVLMLWLPCLAVGGVGFLTRKKIIS